MAFWALAVWGGLPGTVLLLMRKRHAVGVLLGSFLAMVVTTVHDFLLSNGVEVMGTTGMIFAVLIFVIALGLWVYQPVVGVQRVAPPVASPRVPGSCECTG